MSEKYDPTRPWTKYATFDEDYKMLTTEIPKTNYDAMKEIMTPELLGLLMGESRCTNMCIACSQLKPYDIPGNRPCDMQCVKHAVEFLNGPYNEKEFGRMTRFFYIPKEEVEDAE